MGECVYKTSGTSIRYCVSSVKFTHFLWVLPMFESFVMSAGKGFVHEDMECSHYMKNFDAGWFYLIKYLSIPP